MQQAPMDVKLAEGFDGRNEAAWRAQIEKSLKGSDFERRLVSRTADGLSLQPLYSQARDASPVPRAHAGHPWRLVQRVDHPDPEAANRQALEDLLGGASALALVFPASGTARGFGLACDTVADLDVALTGVDLTMIHLRLEPAPAGLFNAGLVAALAARRGLDPATLSISFGMDPIGSLMTRGSSSAGWPETGRLLADAVSALAGHGFKGPLIDCDTRPCHEAGASEAQELAAALATGVAYWQALIDNGIPKVQAERAIAFTFAVDADEFLAVAKLRAMRQLWARVQQASEIPAAPIQIHAESAWRMLARRDAAVNMLRATMATFSAGIAGADGLTVLPHTLAHGLPNAFARRVARNAQTVLIEESNLWRVADPAAGSGAIEAITADLASAAWGLFQEIQRRGGMPAVLQDGWWQGEIGARRDARLKQLATGRLALTGTSAFPQLAEAPVETLDVASPPAGERQNESAGRSDMAFADLVSALESGARRGDVTPSGSEAVTITALPSRRDAEPFEALRDRADAQASRTGQRPAVFLANLGPLAEHTVRATWTKNALAVGGIDVIATDGFTASGDVGAAFAQSGACIACICSSDAVYAELADATAQALKSAGATCVLLAGRPGNNEAAWRAARIDSFLFAGMDMLTALEALHVALAIPPA